MILQPCDIILVDREHWFNPMAWWITQREGDTNISHICMAGKDGIIYTTGAMKLLYFGKVNAADYLKGKTYTVLRIPNLTETQINNMVAFNESLIGNIYNIADFVKLNALSFFGPVKMLGKTPQFMLKKYFCSQAVMGALSHANGIPSKLSDGFVPNPYLGKLDITAYSPSEILEDRWNLITA